MKMTQQECDHHVARLRKQPGVVNGVVRTVHTGFVTRNSLGALVYCPATPNRGTVNPDRDGLEVDSAQAKVMIDAGAGDLRSPPWS